MVKGQGDYRPSEEHWDVSILHSFLDMTLTIFVNDIYSLNAAVIPRAG